MRGLATKLLLIGVLGVFSLAANFLYVVASPQEQPPLPPGPPNEPENYFSETGFFVRGPFLEFYNSRGGYRTFGYPRSRLYYDAGLGLWVQYFDNVRMEWHPSNPAPYKVQLGLLGEEAGMRMPPIPSNQIPIGNPLRRYFPETGHVVSFAFLTFYNDNGGLDIFGYPITEPFMENSHIVQYFQRVRVEWHPERSPSDRAVFGDLGTQFLHRVPPEALLPEPAPPNPSVSSDVARVTAYVRSVITGREGSQTVFVCMVDRSRQPVEGATAAVAVHFPSGTVTYTAGPSDHRGIASVEFAFHSLPVGRKILIDVTVDLPGGRTLTTGTFFVPWY